MQEILNKPFQSIEFQAMTVEDWMLCYCELSHKDLKDHATHTKMINRIQDDILLAVLWKISKAVSCGLGVIHKGYFGIFDIVTHPDMRNKGYGKKLVSGMLAWAAERSVRTAYLQVLSDNQPAIKLYRTLGYGPAYEYYYKIQRNEDVKPESVIRQAQPFEAHILTRISFESKGYWGYPPGYFDIWKTELTISPDYIEKNDVFVYELGGSVTGFYSVVELPEDRDVSGVKIPKGFWLDHMFIEPLNIGKGIGSRMFHHLRKQLEAKGINESGILADPHAMGFYEKMGCEYVMKIPSTIPNRTTPYLIFRP